LNPSIEKLLQSSNYLMSLFLQIRRLTLQTATGGVFQSVPMNEQLEIKWKWGCLVALAMVVLASYPQLRFLAARGGSWAGVYAYVDVDEVAYSAYVQSLIDGRSRKNDPYTGRDELDGKPLPESLFSVQFIPPYVAAIPARILGLSSSTVFIFLMPVMAATTALTLFWVLAITTHDSRVAATGVLVVLCLSTFVSGQGPSRILFGTPVQWNYLPFLRRYVPGMVYPLFLAIFGLAWRAITSRDGRYVARSVGAGLMIGLLVFSYFYLWTAAIAWVCCLAIACLVARPPALNRILGSVSIMLVVATSSLIPYLMLLSQRSDSTDQAQALALTRRPDLLRPSELLAFILLAILVRLIFVRRLSGKDPAVLFVISLLLLPLAVFNQQLITGRSLQPFHYEMFVTSYCLLMAAVIGCRILVRARSLPPWVLSHRALFWIAVLSFMYGINSASAISGATLNENLVRDNSLIVGRRLRELGRQDPGMVFTVHSQQGETLPTLAPEPLLWAFHMAVFPGTRESELKERFYHYLYYSGIPPDELRQLLASKSFAVLTTLFGPGREAAHLTANFRPVTPQEAEEEVRLYSEYIGAFDRQTAGRYLLSYLVVPVDAKFDATNIDRWYQRDEGERVGDFILYRLKLR